MSTIPLHDSVHPTTLLILVYLLSTTGCSSPINPSSFEQPAEDMSLFDLSNTTDDGVSGPDTTGNDMGSLDTGSSDLVVSDISIDSGIDVGTEDLGEGDTGSDVGTEDLGGGDTGSDVGTEDLGEGDTGSDVSVCDDRDLDGVCDEADLCDGGDDALDTDGDGTPDFCDCDQSSDDCHLFATCDDGISGVLCTCFVGYVGDGSVCADIDECALDTDDDLCDPLTECINSPGSYSCTDCPEGYEGTGETECILIPPPVLDPIIWYRFDSNTENSGSLEGEHDAVHNTLSPTYDLGVRGESAYFAPEGNSGVILEDAAGILGGLSEITIGFWAFEETVLVTGNNLIDNRNNATEAGGDFLYHGAAASDDAPNLFSCLEGYGGCQNFGSFTVGEWHHLIIRYNAAADEEVSIWMDNIEQLTWTDFTGDETQFIFGVNALNDMKIGVNTGFFMDDLMIFDTTYNEVEQCIIVIGGTWDETDGCTLPTPDGIPSAVVEPEIEPVIWYPFDGDIDNYGSLTGSYDATPNAILPSYAAGVNGESAYFAPEGGSGIFIEDINELLVDESAITIAFWGYEETVATTLKFLVENRSGFAGGHFIYHAGSATDDAPSFTSCIEAYSGCQSFTSFTVGEWHHFIIRYDAAAGEEVSIYMDGQVENTFDEFLGDETQTPFGENADKDILFGVNTGFHMDDFKIFDTVFDEAEQCVVIIGGEWDTDSGCILPDHDGIP